MNYIPRHAMPNLTCKAQHWARFILILPVLAVLAACSTAPTTYTNMLDDDEKYSPFTKYFVFDSAHRREVVVQALNLVGTDYRWGGEHPDEGMDCSGLVTYVVERVSRRGLPHHAATIAMMTRPIKLGELEPGDLVFFNTIKRRHSHVGIYIGDNRFVHAPAPGQKVRIDSLKVRYYAEHLDGLHTFVGK